MPLGFRLRFFHESVSPKPLSIPLGPFQIFSTICGDIRSSRCTTGVIDTGGKFAASIVDTGGKFASDINNISGACGEFATGAVDTSGAPWLLNISRIFKQIWNDQNVIFRFFGKMIHKKPEAKNLLTLSD